MTTDIRFRIEHDSIGDKEVPADALYGVQTLRAFENFHITGHRVADVMISSIAQLKKASAITNMQAGALDSTRGEAIVKACDEIISGNFRDQFITDPIQGGAGTSFNMNANEVIANRATVILGGSLGSYDPVHPNDHVNMGQSTNDVYPSSGKLAILYLLIDAQNELRRLQDALLLKAKEFDGVIKMGRTQLQDAVPIRLGQEFHAYAEAIGRDIARFDRAKAEMSVMNMGGTAVGTGLNADVQYYDHIAENISAVTGLSICQCKDTIDGTQNLDGFCSVSGIIKSCAVSLSKMSNDLRLMSSGPRTGLEEINLPAKQNGSSIMPGKVNPVIPEVVSQVAFNIIGNDMTVTMAAEAGQLELNAFEPVIFYNLIESLQTLKNGVGTFIDNCILGITANQDHCQALVDNSVGIITALNPYLGYAASASAAKEAIRTGRSLRELLLEKGIITEEKMNSILDPFSMTTPGIKA